MLLPFSHTIKAAIEAEKFRKGQTKRIRNTIPVKPIPIAGPHRNERMNLSMRSGASQRQLGDLKAAFQALREAGVFSEDAFNVRTRQDFADTSAVQPLQDVPRNILTQGTAFEPGRIHHPAPPVDSSTRLPGKMTEVPLSERFRNDRQLGGLKATFHGNILNKGRDIPSTPSRHTLVAARAAQQQAEALSVSPQIEKVPIKKPPVTLGFTKLPQDKVESINLEDPKELGKHPEAIHGLSKALGAFGKALATPGVQKFLGQLGIAFAGGRPDQPGTILGQAGVQQAEGRMLGLAQQMIQKGQDPSSIAGITPDIIEKALQSELAKQEIGLRSRGVSVDETREGREKIEGERAGDVAEVNAVSNRIAAEAQLMNASSNRMRAEYESYFGEPMTPALLSKVEDRVGSRWYAKALAERRSKFPEVMDLALLEEALRKPDGSFDAFAIISNLSLEDQVKANQEIVRWATSTRQAGTGIPPATAGGTSDTGGGRQSTAPPDTNKLTRPVISTRKQFDDMPVDKEFIYNGKILIKRADGTIDEIEG